MIVDWAMTRVDVVITGCGPTSIFANAITGLVGLLNSGAVAILVIRVVVRLGNGGRQCNSWNGFTNLYVTVTADWPSVDLLIVAISGYLLSVSVWAGALMTSVTIRHLLNMAVVSRAWISMGVGS